MNIIKFGVGELGNLRRNLLEDTSKEQFAVLLARTDKIGDVEIFNVLESRIFVEEDLPEQSQAFLRIRKESIAEVLLEISKRIDVNCIIDVHTHPFSKYYTAFSGIDNSDEESFMRYLLKEFPNIRYASIVFSKKSYSARVWNEKLLYETAKIKTASPREGLSDECKSQGKIVLEDLDSQFNRSVLAFGLDAMRLITSEQKVVIVGAGGLGSIIAENLVHSGFQELHLIDNDVLSVSNMNRIVGAYMEDAIAERPKVQCLKSHLERINPSVKVVAYQKSIPDEGLNGLFATSDWVIVATDNHHSRFCVQEQCLKFSTPFISAGVNISLENDKVTDISGEVITVRPGDNLCLSCLKRLNPTRIAHESHPDPHIRERLLGYVSGASVKEPAVKTLNSVIASMCVDVLIIQYTQQRTHEPILVYENNISPCIYPDKESVALRAKMCQCNR